MAYQRTRKVQERLQAKEAAILEAAKAVFTERGYHGTTVRAVAARAGVATGTVYLYFPNKEALFLALMDRLTSLILEAIVSARFRETGVIAKLKASITASMEVFARNRDLARIVLIQAAGAKPEFEERLAQVHASFAGFVEEDLREAGEEGLIPPIDAEIASLAWVGTFYEVIVSWLREGKPAELEPVIPALVSYNMRAIGAEP